MKIPLVGAFDQESDRLYLANSSGKGAGKCKAELLRLNLPPRFCPIATIAVVASSASVRPAADSSPDAVPQYYRPAEETHSFPPNSE